MKTKIKNRGLTALRFGAGLLVIVLLVQLAVPAHHPRSQKVAVSGHVAQNLPPAGKAVSPAAPAPAPAPAPAQTTPPTPKKVATPKTVSSAKPVPVVTPAPESSVNGLAPVPAATTPGSGDSTQTASNPPATTSSYTSTNWAGWMSTVGTFTSVSGSWTAPRVSGNGRSTSADATWIGIGGVSSNDLIQVGTMNSVSAGGRVTTWAFYELLPAFAQTISTVSVAPGDSLSASVSEVSPGQWTISLTNNTNGQSFTQTFAYASSRSSAEWIQEDPSNAQDQLVPLDNFGTATFTNGMTTSSGVSRNILNSLAVPITLVNNAGQALVTTSSLSGGGSSFSVTHN